MYSWIHVNDCNADTHDQYSVDWCASFVSDSMVDWVWWEERPQFIAMLVFWQNGLKSYVVISPPPALEMFALNDPFSYNSPTTELAFQRLFGLCANANCNHDGSYEGSLYRDAVRKRSYNDSLNKRRTTIFKYMMQWSKLTNNRWPYQVPLHHYFIWYTTLSVIDCGIMIFSFLYVRDIERSFTRRW